VPPVETDIEREEKAISLAEQRGRRQQVVDGRLDGHDAHFKRLNGSLERTATELHNLRTEVGKLGEAFRQSTAIAEAKAKAAVSRREFWLGVAAVVGVLVGALINGGTL